MTQMFASTLIEEYAVGHVKFGPGAKISSGFSRLLVVPGARSAPDKSELKTLKTWTALVMVLIPLYGLYPLKVRYGPGFSMGRQSLF